MKSKFVRRLSSLRLWHRLPRNLLHGFLSNFSCYLPWAICRDVFGIFDNFFFFFFFLRIFFAFVNMAPYGSKNFKTLLLQITFESFQNLFWIFFSVVHTRVLFWIFENLSLRFLTIFFLSVNTGPYGSKTSKRYSSL